ncbi:tetratricopeptide repeat protein [Bacteroides sp. 224]|uniref:tetratricopeptide repeat protein n=1 Tax=Bacteroides sp. 224 TaxID=2302936 RepID=UPI0013D0BE05|nr:tetratricopeptide repeat protein [Bacteroides sp. 224]NDV66880.1 hypothetical protein [Bacteroides sp. 224]
MEDPTVKRYHDTIKLLRRRQLKEALKNLRELAAGAPDGWQVMSELDRIETSYTYMLDYMRRNIKDPERQKLQNKLLTDTLAVADQVRLLLEAVDSTRHYFSKKRFMQMLPEVTLKTLLTQMETYKEDVAIADLLGKTSEKALEVRHTHENAQQNLFEVVWTNSAWNSQENNEANEFLQSENVPLNDVSLLVSAVTMSLMACFDIRKLIWLFDAYEHTNTQVNQRALVGLAFLFQLHHERMLLYPEIIARLSLLNENEQFAQELCRVQIQLLRSQETKKIDKKMREEIIPEMMKSVNPRNMKFDFDETDEENNDHNPDWIQNFESSSIGEKLREMSELQMEGADVYMTTFAQLKNYPFFKKMANWFYPFDTEHSSVIQEFSNDKSSLLDMIFQSGLFCDSDKYSMCFTMMHIPQGQRDMMLSQLSEQQINELRDDQKLASMKKYFEKPESISNLYIHSLYRFFKLYPRRHEYRDIFNEPLRLYRYIILQPTLYKTEYIQSIAEFLFRKENTNEAIQVYKSLIELGGDNAEVYQKIGYCLQKEQRYEEAIEAYLTADMMKPDSIWTNRHLATCYRTINEFDKALEYYKKVEAVHPDSASLLFNIGSCLAELGRSEEALQYFFKLDFMNTGNLKVWRAIGWCSFISGKMEQAMRYYEKIIEKKPIASDYLNAGHVAWCSGNTEMAISFYLQSLQNSKDKEDFFNQFYKDERFLEAQGISADDIPLMLDLL